jgi:P-type Ca2+ transporter type 2C
MNEKVSNIILAEKIENLLDKKEQTVCEVYFDGELKEAEFVNEHSASYGIFMHTLALCNESKITEYAQGKFEVTGSEYERAIARYVLNRGFNKNLIESFTPKVTRFLPETDIPSNPTTYSINEKYRVISKASPIKLLCRCAYVLTDSGIVKLSRKIVRDINRAVWLMIENGLKVFAMAIKDIADINTNLGDKNIEKEMIFVGMVGIGNE